MPSGPCPSRAKSHPDIFHAGFLPSSRELDRFYLCRQIRVNLSAFTLLSSREPPHPPQRRRHQKVELVPRDKFDYTPERRQFFKTYADAKFGADVMTYERLDLLFNSPIISHLLVFTDTKTGAEVGVATLYVEDAALAYYYYAFYDLAYFNRNLGMYMMTSAVELFAATGRRHIYLGTCYSENALYKIQFTGAEFFNGFRWSSNLDELKYILQRGHTPSTKHLLETEDYRKKFYADDLKEITRVSNFHGQPNR